MPLQYMLDTNICIYITKQQSDALLQRFTEVVVGDVAISVITYGELLYGISKSKFKKKSMQILDEIISYLVVMPLSVNVANSYAEIRRYLEKQGTIIGNNDLWIAAHAVSLNITLVTNNVKEFKRVPKLKLENWIG